MSSFTYAAPLQAPPASSMAGFRSYLEHSLRAPFTLNLDGCSLLEVIRAAKKAKSRLHPNYPASIGNAAKSTRAFL